MITLQERAAPLLALVDKAPKCDKATAQERDDGQSTCPLCQGDGDVEYEVLNNMDGLPLGVEFFGIGEAFGAAKRAHEILHDLAALVRDLLAENERLHLLIGSNYKPIDVEQYLSDMSANAFTGRRTARNRPEIPTDAGVPSRDEVMDESGYGAGASWPDESRIDTIATNGPTGLHYPEAMANDPDRITDDEALSRAIGQPGSKK